MGISHSLTFKVVIRLTVLNIANELESAAGAFHPYLRVLFDNKQDILVNQLSW